jgi:hypothetical protein
MNFPSWRLAVIGCLALLSAANAETPRESATRAVNDLLGHWWIGDVRTGHLMATHGGCPVQDRGVLWERTVVLCALEGLHMATGEALLRQRLRAQWEYDRQQYRPAELEACGPGSPAPWCDDACWEAIWYAMAYEETGDAEALARAKGMICNVSARWLDDRLGGGLWYNEQRKVKSLYSVAFVYVCLWVYEETGDRSYLEQALAQYRWIEAHLLREDGLYWCDYSAGPPADPGHPPGPIGAERPHRIAAASSPVYLGGALGIGACQAWLYQLTGEEAWRVAALRTAHALSDCLTDARGCFMNDRDAFTNGVFASFWARHMAALPGAAPFEALDRTAKTIAAARTTSSYTPAYGPGGEGFYPGDWDGGQTWEAKGSMANMMHVSASSVGFIVGAAWPGGHR